MMKMTGLDGDDIISGKLTSAERFKHILLNNRACEARDIEEEVDPENEVKDE